MSRAPRNENPGFHHVVTRGNNKRPIYLDERDRMLFCLTAERVRKRYGWDVLAYVLMSNHYHLLLRVGERGLSDGMHDLNHSYAVTFNARHGRINHVFGKRFWNRELTTDASLQAAARYIVQNPRRAGLVADLDDYPWSSYRATVGLDFPHVTLDRDSLLGFFGPAPSASVAAYTRFCENLPLGAELEGPRLVPGTVT
ncbi:MAG TPA: transposase [Gaiellaceae bacterium]|nr:transposase [Gaiellaceae bacterium]